MSEPGRSTLESSVGGVDTVGTVNTLRTNVARFTLQRPVLERDAHGPYVRLQFDAYSVSGLWVSEFMKRDHHHGWPPDLPLPYYHHGEIRVKDLRPGDVARLVEALREWVEETNQEVERLHVLAAEHAEEAERRLQFEAEVIAAERALDELFSQPQDSLANA